MSVFAMILLTPIFLLTLAAAAAATFLFAVVGAVLFQTGCGKRVWGRMEDWFHVYQFLTVPELNQTKHHNHLYTKLSLYLHSLPSIQDSHLANLVTGKNQNDVVLCLAPNQTIRDHFLGATVYWFNQPAHPNPEGTGTYVLKIRKVDKRRILRPYLQHIHAVADEIELQGKRDLRLFTNSADEFGQWRSVPFIHPSTFDTIAMEPDLKSKVKSDLESFLRAKQYYHRLGRVWKRSFLLYGPSGTGKSSFVAAMANFLSYDVFDIDLNKIPSDSDLKLLLLHTTPKSVVVIEDLDRFVAEKTERISVSGILNFMDGLITSCCAEERVMVFTMNTKEHVDPNMLRPGRVDVHIHFPLCDFSAFKTLANSYLGVKDHKLFPQVQEIFQNGASLSPAEIGELMIANRNSPSRAIRSVITALQTDGDGRGCGLIGRQKEEDEMDEPDGVVCSEGVHTVKDLRRLYSFFRFRVTRKSSSSNSSLTATPLR
ncbi:AAA-ATPase At2g46620-like [Vigna umbellata]|uniref:AAA-ATPase At2g46620-like n=1 Tax=Vigna umbellata TaxID=87088 RepID=UPI001F5F8227|nr:AAA-ATPase At2g46620-like [Vigna umbellata]